MGLTTRFFAFFFLLIAGGWVAPVFGADLRILVEDDAEPFSNRDGSGYANDLVRAAFAAVGVPVELKVVPYARCKAAVLVGTDAACFNMSWDASFDGVLKFADLPLFSVTPVYFQNRAHRLAVNSESELGKGTVIGIVNGYEYPNSAMKTLQRGAVFAPARSEQVNLKKLALNRIDTALVMENQLRGSEFWSRDAGVYSQVIPTFYSTQLDSFIGFSRLHPRGMSALAQFNTGFALIRANGTAKNILKKWSGAK